MNRPLSNGFPRLPPMLGYIQCKSAAGKTFRALWGKIGAFMAQIKDDIQQLTFLFINAQLDSAWLPRDRIQFRSSKPASTVRQTEHNVAFQVMWWNEVLPFLFLLSKSSLVWFVFVFQFFISKRCIVFHALYNGKHVGFSLCMVPSAKPILFPVHFLQGMYFLTGLVHKLNFTYLSFFLFV